MTNQHRTSWSASAVAVLQILSTLGLLALSSWFIAACAVAGLSSMALQFNYAIPATLIRALALLRISSAYGERWLGHQVVLQRLITIRSTILEQAFSHPISLSEWQEHQLQQQSEEYANAWLLFTQPLLATSFALSGLILLCVLYWPSLLLSLTVTFLALILCWALSHSASRELQKQLPVREQAILHMSSEWLSSTTLWMLQDNPEKPTLELLRNYDQLHAQQRRIRHNLNMAASAIAMIALMYWATYLDDSIKSQPLIIVLITLIWTLPDWLAAAIRAVSTPTNPPLIETSHNESWAQKSSKGFTDDAIQLNEFAWTRAFSRGRPLTLRHSTGECCFISGESGSGKSSLLLALAGQLNHSGSFRHSPKSKIRLIHQHAPVINDTLAANLKIANPAVVDAQMIEALNRCGLQNLASQGNLEQWLGVEGRQLSSGERKKLGIARAWLTKAEIVLIDEPFEGLDAQSVECIVQVINAMSAHAIILVASHISPPTLRVGSRIQL